MDYLKAPGVLTENERKRLRGVASQTKRGDTIINVGVGRGASIICFYAGNRYARIIGIDIDCSKFKFKLKGVHLVKSHSGQWKWDGKPAAIVFIDGDHGRLGVLADTKFADYVKPGGLIIFHDCFERDGRRKSKIGAASAVNKVVSKWYEREKGKWKELRETDSMRVFRKNMR